MPHRYLLPSTPKAQRLTAPDPSEAPNEPAWPTFPGGATFVGTSASGVNVWVDPALGDPGMQNASDLLADADRVVGMNNAIFGAPAGPVDVIVYALGGATDGTGGADHGGCDFQTGNAIEVCASFGSSIRCSALFEAELSECMMGGDLCGVSTGEALSRWCASAVSNNALADFATAPTWSGDGMPDFVDSVDPTDQNPDSTGCGMAFLSWLFTLTPTGAAGPLTLADVAQAMVSLGQGATLAQLYATLIPDAASNAWPNFQAAIAALPFGVGTDDPFGSGVPAPAPPGPPPAPPGPPPAPPPAPCPTGVPTLTLAQAQAVLAAGWPTS